MLAASWKKNDKKARILILSFSLVVFVIVSALERVKLDVELPFDVHLFSWASAVINSLVAILLVAALIAVKRQQYLAHKRLMMTAMILSILFLVCYIAHHLFDKTTFGGTGTVKTVYYIILFTHIPLAGISLPFILFSAYRALIGEYPAHKKLVRITWPIWFYVAVTGVVVFLMMKPYY